MMKGFGGSPSEARKTPFPTTMTRLKVAEGSETESAPRDERRPRDQGDQRQRYEVVPG